MTGSVLSVRGLNKRYGKRTVVKDVSLDIASGEVVGLLGPNGAGKTTSFYMIVGLVSADGGEMRLDQHDIRHLPIHQRAKLGLGYLPQEASIFRKMTVEENILAILEIAHWYDIVLILAICSLFWSTSWIGLVILLAVTYMAEIIIDNVTPRMTWKWMLTYVWAVGISLSFFNMALLYAKSF